MVADSELIDEARAGSQVAYGALYKRLRGRAMQIAFSFRLPDPEDFVHDVSSKVLMNLHKFDGKARFSTWAFAVMRREALQVKRQMRSLKGSAEMVYIDDNEDEEKRPFEIADAQRLEDEVIARIDVERLLDSLSEHDRFIMESYLLEGEKLNSLSLELGYAGSTVRGKYRKICERLRSGEYFQEEEAVSETEQGVVIDDRRVQERQDNKQRFCKCGCGTPIGPKGWAYAKGHTPSRRGYLEPRKPPVVNIPRTVQLSVTEKHLDIIWNALGVDDKAAAVQSALLRMGGR